MECFLDVFAWSFKSTEPGRDHSCWLNINIMNYSYYNHVILFQFFNYATVQKDCNTCKGSLYTLRLKKYLKEEIFTYKLAFQVISFHQGDIERDRFGTLEFLFNGSHKHLTHRMRYLIPQIPIKLHKNCFTFSL